MGAGQRHIEYRIMNLGFVHDMTWDVMMLYRARLLMESPRDLDRGGENKAAEREYLKAVANRIN